MRPSLLVCLALALFPLGAAAQPPGATVPGAQAPPQPPPAQPAQPAQPPPSQPPPAESRQPPPVLVVAWSDAQVPPELGVVIRDVVVEQLTPFVRRRPVVALTDPSALATVATCTEALCIGAQIANAGAVTGVLVSSTRTVVRAPARAPTVITLQVVDPVSGAERHPPLTVTIEPGEEARTAELLAPVTAQLGQYMPAPPPRASLLIATNVDEAEVTINGHPAGQSPIAPIVLPPGRYVVRGERAGFMVQQRTIDVEGGQAARLDLDLEPDAEALALLTAQEEEARDGGDQGPWYTRWYVLAGGGAVVAGAIVAVIIIATSSGGESTPSGIPVPPIE